MKCKFLVLLAGLKGERLKQTIPVLLSAHGAWHMAALDKYLLQMDG